ncbi:MAG: FKBP-type peptidyl-prolyl cis-trans isomerase [Paramuribaculum sp.]|nr:FKBP-type peptidyl-prolyl cis-trans isomerase [Paramuribaculum sp.]
MKKLLMAGGVVALIMGMSSCSSSTSSSSTDKGLTDSIATYLGKVQGSYYSERVTSLPESEQQKFKKQSFLRGLKQVLEADTSDMAYMIGLQVGTGMAESLNQFSQQGVDINRKAVYDEFAKSFLADSVDQAQLMEAQTTFQQLMNQAQQLIQQKQMEKRQAELAKVPERKEEGKKYVDDIKSNDPSVVTSESGLSYKVVEQGSGATPQDGDRVRVKYTGKLPDGTVFDSNESAVFGVNGVIPGFAEGLKMMNPGSKYVLYIPSDLGYGDQGNPTIPGGSTLVFDVEVLEILP